MRGRIFSMGDAFVFVYTRRARQLSCPPSENITFYSSAQKMHKERSALPLSPSEATESPCCAPPQPLPRLRRGGGFGRSFAAAFHAAVLITTHHSRLPYSQPSKRGEAVKRLESEDCANTGFVGLTVVVRVAAVEVHVPRAVGIGLCT